MKTMKMLTGLYLVILAGSCTCDINTLSTIVLGKWQLVKRVSPARTQNTFPYQEILKIKIINDGGGNALTVDSTLRDRVLTKTATWVGVPDVECKNSGVAAFYTTGLQRKYWVSNKSQSMEATDYVSQIGSPADTVRYFYERIP